MEFLLPHMLHSPTHLETKHYYYSQHCKCECLLPHLKSSEPFQGFQLLQLAKMRHQPNEKLNNIIIVKK